MFIVCHYGEIALKGKNRKFFEEKLVENIKKALAKGSFKQVRRISGRVLVELADKADQGLVKQGLQNVFGLTYFAFASSCPAEIEAIKAKAIELFKTYKGSFSVKSFRVTCQRSDKSFALTSQQVNEQVGGEVVEKLGKTVNLTKPDIVLFIEITGKNAYLYTEKIKGLGGLPVGVSGRAVSLISGGIDSPVASFLAMKRGLELVFCHFHAVPYVDKASIDKVKQITALLAQYQPKAKLYLIPFGEIQKEILLKTKPALRVVLYRRLMFKIAEQIAKKEKASALITGENLGQVASQTLENMAVIEKAVGLPVFRPLFGFDKLEIIEKAKQIGTYDISILPHQDCCSRFLPPHPATKAKQKEVEQEEAKIDLERLIGNALNKAETEAAAGDPFT